MDKIVIFSGGIDMNNQKEIVLTQQGLDELQRELDHLKTVTRKEVSNKIKEARSFGDLSENAEYDEAKNEQAEVESRINDIEEMLKHVRVIGDEDIVSDEVSPGCRVRILDIEENDELEYTIVSSAEADQSKMRLSYDSPVGKALLHHKAGETITVSTPGGDIPFKILEIIK